MPDLDEVLQQAQDEDGLSEEMAAAIKEAASPKWFREEAKRLKERAAKADELEAAEDRRKLEPKVLKAFEKAGVDVEQLRGLERKEVLAFADFEDEDKLAAFIEENELPTKESGSDDEDEDEPKVSKIAKHGKEAQRRGAASKSTLTLEDTESWDQDDWERFREADEKAWELLGSNKNGKTVTEVTTTFTP